MAGAIYALSGGGFIVATLLMARVLDEHTFSQAVLIIALCSVAIAVAPAGLNGVALRHDLRLESRLLAAGMIAATIVAGLTAAAGIAFYQLEMVSTIVLFVAIIAGGIAILARTAFQRAQQFKTMVGLYQIANGVFLIAALLMVAGLGRQPWFPTLLMGCWYLILGLAVWRWALANQKSGSSLKLHMWRDAANFGGVALAGQIMIQLERLLIPLTTGAQDLATYAVVAAVALAPYRMLEMGTMSTLTARLRHAVAVAERQALLTREIVLLVALSVAGGASIVVIGPYVIKLVRPGAEISMGLLFAVVISGVTRILSALSHGAASAVCAGRELHWLNIAGWFALVVGSGAGWLLSSQGLEGLVYGVAMGWASHTLLAATLAVRHLKTPVER